MSSDSEIDDLQKFEDRKQRELARKAGISDAQFEEYEMSDEEVMALDDAESSSDAGQDGYYEQDDKTVQAKRDKVNRDIEDNWGQTRDNYFGGEDDIGEDEGASDEEEQEALRLRERELEDMNASDFVDEDDMEGWKQGVHEVDDLNSTVADPLGSIDVSKLSSTERRELIEEKFPAVLLLSNQLKRCEQFEEELKDSPQSEEMKEIGKSALQTYKGMIYAYFALFTDRINKGDLQGLSQLEEHPVNEGLLTARQIWLNYQEACVSGKPKKKTSVKNAKPAGKKLAEELALSEEEDETSSNGTVYMDCQDDFMHDSFASSNDDDEGQEEDDEEDDEDEFSIAKPQPVQKLKTKVVGDFDEAADTIEEQARAKNKQSLRFYTSQIGKNNMAKRDEFSGDIDLPYREREFERRQRLVAEAQKRGQLRQDNLGDESDSGEEAPGDDEALNLYNEAEAEKAAKRAIKMQRHADAVDAAREGRINQYLSENPNIDKRAINYQIEKNKGLTRKRKKENRNARVKKRVRYEAAQKRLKGVRREYKQPEGPYQGELTGIRKNLTHSTRFKN